MLLILVFFFHVFELLIFKYVFIDIIFCIDDDGNPVVIPESIKSKITFNDFQKLPELGTWFAIIMLVRNSVLYYSNEYNGLTVCKIRQLKRLGYESIPVIIGPSVPRQKHK